MSQNKLSRREAIKILGTATGASLLANIPAKWSRPEVTGSQLPAFAQTSCGSLLVEITETDGTVSLNANSGWDDIKGQISCRTGCFDFVVSINSGTYADIQITTLAGGPYPYSVTGVGSQFLVNLDTGEIGQDGEPVNGCSWPI